MKHRTSLAFGAASGFLIAATALSAGAALWRDARSGGTEPIQVARSAHLARLSVERPDACGDYLAAVRLVIRDDVESLDVAVFDRRGLFEDSWRLDPFSVPPPPVPVATASFVSPPTGATLRVPSVGYGRKRVEIRATSVAADGTRLPMRSELDTFVHEGLGATPVEIGLRTVDRRSIRIVDPAGVPLADVHVELLGATWSSQRRVQIDSDGWIVAEDTDRLGAVLDANGALLGWIEIAAGDRVEHVFESRRLTSPPTDRDVLQAFARAQTEVGRWLPVPARAVDRGLAIDVPASARRAVAFVERESGAWSLFDWEVLPGAEEAPLPAVSPLERVTVASGGEVFASSGSAASLLWLDDPVGRLVALGERAPSAGPSACLLPDGAALWRFDPATATAQRALPLRSSGLRVSEPVAETELPVRTFRAYDTVEVEDQHGTNVAVGFTDRYAEWFFRTELRGTVFVQGRTWSGERARRSGALLGVTARVGLADGRDERPESGRADTEGFLVDAAGRPFDGIVVLAQWYPGPDRFAHRQATTNAHGYWRLDGLPATGPVDLLLRDPAHKSGETQRHFFRTHRRIAPIAWAERPFDFVLPAGQVLVTVSAEARQRSPRVELRAPAEDPSQAGRLHASRALRDGARDLRFEGVPDGEYEVRIVAGDDGAVIWRGSTRVKKQEQPPAWSDS